MKVIAIFCFLVLTISMYSKELTLYAGHIPPYAIEESRSGVGYDILEALKEAQGNTTKTNFLPWKRAQIEAQNGNDIAIIPLTRTEQRESQYKWIIMLFKDDMVFATTSSTKPFNFEELKKKRVGVLLGSFGETDLKNLGFTNVEPVLEEEQNAKKLETNRIDAWFVARMVAPYVYNKLKFDKEKLKYSDSYRKMEVYLGGSKNVSDAEVDKWNKAMEKIKENGVYDKIVNKYK